VHRYGSTADEMRRGETIEMRMSQEMPDVADGDDTDDEPGDDYEREVGGARAGRLVATHDAFEDDEADQVAFDVGVSGGAATAEEAAMHVIDEDDDQPIY
jgi:hypothetical protein